jgi:hypothetical protein
MCRDTLLDECEKMLVREDSIAFTAIPKHASFHVQTLEIPFAMLESAAIPPALPPLASDSQRIAANAGTHAVCSLGSHANRQRRA